MARTSTRTPAGRSLAGLFAADPLGAVLTVLREAGPDSELRAEEVKAALVARGVPADGLRAWRRVQARLIAHDRVSVGGDRYRRTYRYLPEPPKPSPAQALELLAGHRLPSPRRAELVEIVRSALTGGDHPRPASRAQAERVAQGEKDAITALAGMAIEVEELAANEASSRAVVHTVRALTKLVDLRPIERAGEMTRFDRARHTSVGGRIADGASVFVIRPGYVWCRPEGDILLARAVVQDRSTR